MKYKADPVLVGMTYSFLVSHRADIDFSLALVLTEKKKFDVPKPYIRCQIHITQFWRLPDRLI